MAKAESDKKSNTRELGLQATVEMLRRELDASKSVTDHLQFLKAIAAGEQVAPGVRDHLLSHITEEEAEHQAHLARLLPTLESLAVSLGGEPEAPKPAAPAPAPTKPTPPLSAGLTVGSLIQSRPWYTRPQ